MKARIAFAAFMGLITTGLVSFALISINAGFNSHFLIAWTRSWAISFVIAFSTVLFMGPRVQLLINKLLKSK